MLEIEYLITIENVINRFNTVESFNNLLQTDSRISINSNKLNFKNLNINYSLQSGRIGETKDNFYDLTLSCEDDSRLEGFTELLRALKTIIQSVKGSSIQELKNDISLHYNHKAYNYIFNIENLMRKLITKFMVVNVGVDWKYRIPDNVSISDSKGGDKLDKTHLHNYDFIQLSELLFSERFPDYKKEIINKLKSAKEVSDLNLDEIKSLIPTSNWDKYFSTIIKCNNLKSKWEELYKERCKVAHNKFLTESEFNNVRVLCNYISPFLISAIKELDNIKVSEVDRENFIREDALNQYRELSSEFEKLDGERGFDRDYFETKSLLQELSNNLSSLKEADTIQYAEQIKRLEADLKLEETRFISVQANYNLRKEKLAKMEIELDELRPLAFPTEDELIKHEFINLRAKMKRTFTDILKDETLLEGMINGIRFKLHTRGINISTHKINKAILSLFNQPIKN